MPTNRYSPSSSKTKHLKAGRQPSLRKDLGKSFIDRFGLAPVHFCDPSLELTIWTRGYNKQDGVDNYRGSLFSLSPRIILTYFASDQGGSHFLRMSVLRTE